MEDTNGQPTSQILTEIQFKVTRKGYDPSEVDAFLERLSSAVSQMQEKLRQSAATAAAAEARASEAQRVQAALQSRINELEGAPVPAAAVSPEVEADQAASILAMAQRTADAAVNDARTSAAKLVADAETEASNILRDAQSKAEASIGDIDARRQELTADRDALEAFMDEQRAALSADLSRIQAVLVDPRALRVAPLPVDREASSTRSVSETSDELAVPSSDLPTMATPAVAAESNDSATPVVESGGSARIFDAEADGEKNDEGQLFGESDDAADEAMRRFFDADFDDDDRFGR
jgi:cell division initiation protein